MTGLISDWPDAAINRKLSSTTNKGLTRHILKSDLPICLKRKLFNQRVLPVLTYGAETLTLSKKAVQKIKVAQHAMERVKLELRSEIMLKMLNYFEVPE